MAKCSNSSSASDRVAPVLDKYPICVAQPPMRPVYHGPGAPFRAEAIAENTQRLCHIVERAARDHGAKLVVFPEFCVQGFAVGRTPEDWERAGILLPGAETAALAKVARAHDIHVGGAVYERIAEFPGRYFMTGFMISPDGTCHADQLSLVYRKLYALSSKTRPGDIHDAYVARSGTQLFPVASTPLGKIGCVVAGDLAMPEMTRALAMQGAELVFVPIAANVMEGYAGPSEAPPEALGTATSALRRVRAWENLVYVATSNIGPFIDSDGAVDGARIPSEVVDYLGRVVARADSAEQELVMAEIDMRALRAHRADIRLNYLAHLQPELHAPTYTAARIAPLNGLAARPPRNEQDVIAVAAKAWREAVGRGTFNG